MQISQRPPAGLLSFSGILYSDVHLEYDHSGFIVLFYFMVQSEGIIVTW